MLDTNVGIHILEAFFPRNSSKNCTINGHTFVIFKQHNKSVYIRGHKCCFSKGILQIAVLVESRQITPVADSDTKQNGRSDEKIRRDQTEV